jgi:hypothetical protein
VLTAEQKVCPLRYFFSIITELYGLGVLTYIENNSITQLDPRWASHNLGVFLCIRCGGLHRRMGTHISKVKSVSMDSWTMEQIEVRITLVFCG